MDLEERESAKELAVRAAVGKLDERELYAYKVFCDSKLPTIAPSTSSRMFEAYLQGKSCDDIQKLMSGFTLGQIVHARVLGEWDRLRDEYLDRLLVDVRRRVQQSELETIDLVADLLAASKRVITEKLRRFLINNDPEELKGVPVATTIKEWSNLVALLMTVTGRGDVKRMKGEVEVEHHHSFEPASIPVSATVVPPTPDQAADIVETLLLEPKA